MSTIDNFNRIPDCSKISPDCIDAETRLAVNPELETGICLYSSWGDFCIDIEPLIKAGESCTTLYLSPETDPNCLVYEPEEKCGDNICINGDDLSRIISMQYLKDVDQTNAPTNGDIYMYDGESGLFKPFNLQEFIDNYNATINNMNAAINNLIQKLTPPADAPDNVGVVFGNINLYSDPNVVIEEGSGTVTTLNKNHGLYTHLLANNVFGDELFG